MIRNIFKCEEYVWKVYQSIHLSMNKTYSSRWIIFVDFRINRLHRYTSVCLFFYYYIHCITDHLINFINQYAKKLSFKIYSPSIQIRQLVLFLNVFFLHHFWRLTSIFCLYTLIDFYRRIVLIKIENSTNNYFPFDACRLSFPYPKKKKNKQQNQLENNSVRELFTISFINQ